MATQVRMTGLYQDDQVGAGWDQWVSGRIENILMPYGKNIVHFKRSPSETKGQSSKCLGDVIFDLK